MVAPFLAFPGREIIRRKMGKPRFTFRFLNRVTAPWCRWLQRQRLETKVNRSRRDHA